ncbi:MAG: sensor histidine kinase [Kiritimatiellae bacterium]|nr:sensor histidine kinase [Kiritimatiellia bacterium]
MVHVSGMIAPDPSGIGTAVCSQLVVEAHGNPPPVNTTSLSGIKGGKYDNLPVKVQGTIKEVFRDDIDPSWYYIVLTDDNKSIYLTLHASYANLETVQKMTGAFVAVSGLCSPWDYGYRVTLGRLINLLDFKAIEVIRPAPSDPFDVPEVVTIRFPNPEDIPPLERRRLSGKVIAVWHGNRILVKGENGHVHTVELSGGKVPKYGAMIETAGLLKTDLYRMNLSDAIWRTVPSGSSGGTGSPCLPQKPEPVSISQLLTDSQGRAAVQIQYHGQPITVKGMVRSLPSPDDSTDRLGLECESRIVPVDASSCPEAFGNVEIGCEIEVSGICLFETENWRPNEQFPRIEGFAVIVRTPGDVRIVSRPPWWTAKRLLVVIGALLAALAGIFIWNRSLNRLAELRGRKLLREEVAHIDAELRIEERSRLAIELHDTISQNLTAASMQIDTAVKLLARGRDGAAGHLGVAAKTIASCREELRDCIWDLRNCTLDGMDMASAIGTTLAPRIADAALSVRFAVRRNALTDNTVHAILCIIRELASNAVRHGRAKSIKVAGAVEGGSLVFSVTDDGCGFDMSNVQGIGQGHYGLQGIRERLARLHGNMSIDSETGKGARIRVSMPIPEEKRKEFDDVCN